MKPNWDIKYKGEGGGKIKTKSIWTFRKIGIMTSQQGSMFQNSEILPSEIFFFFSKVVICLDFDFLSPVVHDIQIESLWPNFESQDFEEKIS